MKIGFLITAAAVTAAVGTSLVAGAEAAQALPRSPSCTGALIEYYYDIAMYHAFDGRTAIDLAQGNYPQANNDADAAAVWANKRDTMQTHLLNAGCW